MVDLPQMKNKPTHTEKELLNEVDSLAADALEQYVESWQYVRILGNVLLKVVARIESGCDELIISWNEKIKHPYTLSSDSSQIIQKYKPLLSKMYFINKVNALADYKLLKKGKGLYKKLGWLNDRRNKFAHYGVYRFELQQEYYTSNERITILRDLKRIIQEFDDFRKDIVELLIDPKVLEVIKMKHWV